MHDSVVLTRRSRSHAGAGRPLSMPILHEDIIAEFTKSGDEPISTESGIQGHRQASENDKDGDIPIKPIKRRSVTFNIQTASTPIAKPLPTFFEHSEDVPDTDDDASVEDRNLEIPQDLGSTSDLTFKTYSPVTNALIKAVRHTRQTMTDAGASLGFVPQGLFNRTMSRATINAELGRVEESLIRRILFWKSKRRQRDIDNETLLILGDGYVSSDGTQHGRCYRKIFAILLLINRPAAIRRFIAAARQSTGIDDSDLPLLLDTSNKKFILRSSKAGREGAGYDCFSGWTNSALESFEKRQWALLVPIFKDGDLKTVQQIDNSSTILPFTYREILYESPQGDDFETVIYKVKIHDDHHTFKNCERHKGFFIVKKVDGRKEGVEMEYLMLKRIHHEHVNSLLATYQHGRYWNFIMPWARCDLLTYWQRENPNPARDKKTLLWVASQCAGIAQALKQVHRYSTMHLTNSTLYETNKTSSGRPGLPQSERSGDFYGVHGDIKPTNLLWFPNYGESNRDAMGTIKLSDFGAGDLTPAEFPSTRMSGAVAYTPSYRPPEFDRGKLISGIRDSGNAYEYDVWTLGCLFLEFLTWYAGGWELVEMFSISRKTGPVPWISRREGTFFETTAVKDEYGRSKQEIRLKNSVIQHVQTLRNMTHHEDIFWHLLDTIENKMLLVQPNIENELIRKQNKKRRMTCAQVHDEFVFRIEEYMDSDVDGLDGIPSLD